MTSFELYTKYRNCIKNSNREIFSQRAYANEILGQLWNEIIDKNIFPNIEFIFVVKSMIRNYFTYHFVDQTKLSIFDAYVFTTALWYCVQSDHFIDNAIEEAHLPYLFSMDSLDEKMLYSYMNSINNIIFNIEKDINTKQLFARPVQNKVCILNTDMCGNIPKQQSLLQNGNGDKAYDEAPLSEVTHRRSEPTNEIENNDIQVDDMIINEESENKFLDSDIKKRRIENIDIINKWHSEIDDINGALKSMQPDVSKMLENIMGFSDKITEKYVLQFARMQIELYNFISDNYMYHKNASEQSGNQDYINAVDNYEEFLYSISDALAVFGVEEIASHSGDSFDGKIHEAKICDFSSRNAIIKKSIRSGYRYKDIIIQKERVEL